MNNGFDEFYEFVRDRMAWNETFLNGSIISIALIESGKKRKVEIEFKNGQSIVIKEKIGESKVFYTNEFIQKQMED